MKENGAIFWLLSLIAAVLGFILYYCGYPLHCLIGCLCASMAVLCLLAILLGRRYHAAQNENRRLVTALEEAQAAFNTRSDELKQACLAKNEAFRSTLSHSLRIPISIVEGYADLLARDLVAEESVRREYLNKMVDRTHYMSQVLSKQLVEARDVESESIVCTRIELVALVRQICADMQNAAHCRGVSIQIISAAPELYVQGDLYQLNKVFFNLLENSLKYMGRDGIITVKLSQSQNAVNVMVKDDGMGLDAEETRHIFEWEFQGSNHASGHGHGLYLVSRAIARMGGTVTAESQPGKGMGVFIVFPVAEQVPGPSQPNANLTHSVRT